MWAQATCCLMAVTAQHPFALTSMLPVVYSQRLISLPSHTNQPAHHTQGSFISSGKKILCFQLLYSTCCDFIRLCFLNPWIEMGAYSSLRGKGRRRGRLQRREKSSKNKVKIWNEWVPPLCKFLHVVPLKRWRKVGKKNPAKSPEGGQELDASEISLLTSLRSCVHGSLGLVGTMTGKVTPAAVRDGITQRKMRPGLYTWNRTVITPTTIIAITK